MDTSCLNSIIQKMQSIFTKNSNSWWLGVFFHLSSTHIAVSSLWRWGCFWLLSWREGSVMGVCGTLGLCTVVVVVVVVRSRCGSLDLPIAGGVGGERKSGRLQAKIEQFLLVAFAAEPLLHTKVNSQNKRMWGWSLHQSGLSLLTKVVLLVPLWAGFSPLNHTTVSVV